MTRFKVVGLASHLIVYGVGVGVGILITKRYYKEQSERLLAEELAREAKIRVKSKKRHLVDHDTLPKMAGDLVITKEDLEGYEQVLDDNPYNLNWDSTELNYEEEKKNRSDDAPYVISKDEFDYDKPEYGKIDLEYYQMEQVLLDDRTEPMTDVDDIVGEANLKRFGHGSGDRRLVYIRNEELETDFEIRMMMGSYAVDVLGLDDPHDEGKRWTQDQSTNST